MPSLLASQLSKIKETHHANQPSLLLDKKQALKWDKESFLSLGRSGLLDLIAIQPLFEPFQETLFSEKCLQSDRMLMNNQENALLDSLISDFLILLSPHFLHASSLKVLEWLIHHYKINELNVSQIIKCILPYHETKQFVLMVSTLILVPGSQWEFLQVIQKSQIPMDRATLVRRCQTDSSILVFSGELMALYKSKKMLHKPLALYYTMTVLHYIESIKLLKEQDVRLLLPTVMPLLKMHQPEFKEYHASALMIVTLLSSKAVLESRLVSEILFFATQGLSIENFSNTVLMMANVCQRHPMEQGLFIDKILRRWISFPDSQNQILKICSDFTCIPFVKLFLEGLLECILQSNETEGALYMDALSSFVGSSLFQKHVPYRSVLEGLCDKTVEGIAKEDKTVNQEKWTLIFKCLHSVAAQEMDSVLSIHLKESQPKSKKVYAFVFPLLSGSLSEPLESTSTSLYLGLYDAMSKTRSVSLERFLEQIQNENCHFSSEEIQSILMDKLKEEDMDIVKQVLKFGAKANKFLESDALVTHLLTLVHQEPQGKIVCLALEWIVSCWESIEAKDLKREALATLFSRLFIFEKNSNPCKSILRALQETPIQGWNAKDLANSSLEGKEWNRCVLASLCNSASFLLKEFQVMEYSLLESKNVKTQIMGVILLNECLSKDSQWIPLATRFLLDATKNWNPSLNCNLESLSHENCMERLLSTKESPKTTKYLVWTLQTTIQALGSFPLLNGFFSVAKVQRDSAEWVYWKLFEMISCLSNTSLLEDFLLSFFSNLSLDLCIQFTCNILLNCARPVSKCVGFKVLESFIQSQSSFVDVQLLVPCLLISLGDECQKVRSCAVSCLESFLSFYKTCENSKKSKESIYQYDIFYGPKTKNVLYLKTSKMEKFLSDLCSRSKEIRMDSMAILNILKSLFDSKSGHEICQFLLSLVLALPENGISSRLLYLLSAYDSPLKFKMLAPMIKELLESPDSDSLLLLSGILSTLTVNTVGSLFSKSSKWIYPVLDTSHPSFNIQMAEVVLNQIGPLHFSRLSLEDQGKWVQCLVGLLAQDIRGLSSQIKKILGTFELSGDHFLGPLNSWMKELQETQGETVTKKSKQIQTENPSSLAFYSLIQMLEILETKPALSLSFKLISPCFQLLGIFLGMETNGSFMSLEYAKQLLLSVLNSLLQETLTHSCHSIKESDIQVDSIIQCIRVTDHSQSHNLAFLVLSTLSQMVPSLVIKSIMPIFTFMGTNLLRMDDDFSFLVIQKTMKLLVPLSHSENSLEIDSILELFVDALGHIPRHKRLGIFKLLIETLGPLEYMSKVLILILFKKSGSGEHEFCHQLLLEFEPSLVLTVLGKILQEYTKLDKQEQFSLEKNVLIRFVQQHVCGKRFLQSIVILEDSCKELFRTEIVQLIQEILSLVSRVDSNLELVSWLYETLSTLLDLVTLPTYLEMMTDLIQNESLNVSVKAMFFLQDKVKSLEWTQETVLLFIPITKQLLKALETPSIQKKQVLLSCIGELAQGMAKTEPDLFMDSCPILLSKDALLHSDLQVSCCAMIALSFIVSGIGPSILPYLSQIMSVVLSRMKDALSSTKKESMELCLLTYLTVSKSFLNAIPRFMSPYLKDMVSLICSSVLVPHPKCLLVGQELLEMMAKQVSCRVLLPIVFDLIPGILTDPGKDSVPCFFKFVSSILKQMSKTELIEFVSDLTKLFLQGLDFRIQVTCTAKESWTMDAILNGEESILDSLMQFILKLNDKYFKPLFLKIVDWATFHVSFNQLSFESQKQRQLVLFRFLNAFLGHVKTLGIPYYTYTLDTCISLFKEFETKAYDDKVSLWKYLLSSLTLYLSLNAGNSMDQARFDKLLDPLISQALSFKSWYQTCNVDEDYVSLMSTFWIPCVVALAQFANSEVQRKSLNRSICMNTRHSDPLIRFLSVSVLKELYVTLAEDMLAYFPETVPFIAELMEDEDEQVEHATQILCSTIQEYIGEDIQHYFNSE